MTDAFNIGEIAIVNKPGSPYHGAEITITAPLHMTAYIESSTGTLYDPEPCYGISVPWRSDGRYVSPPRYLRKKRLPPPREEVGEWDLCPWQPAKRVTVSES
jgi:hypothetical protein